MERRIFQNLKVAANDLPTLIEVAKQDCRYALIRKITYQVELPPVRRKRTKKLQSKLEVRENNKAFTTSVLVLFEQLSVWERKGDAGFELILEIQSPSDAQDLSGNDHRHDGKFVWHVRNLYALLEFDSPDAALPSLAQVSEFNYETRGLHPSTLQVICNSLPFLKKTRWFVKAPERRFPELRKARKATRFVSRPKLRLSCLEY